MSPTWFLWISLTLSDGDDIQNYEEEEDEDEDEEEEDEEKEKEEDEDEGEKDDDEEEVEEADLWEATSASDTAKAALVPVASKRLCFVQWSNLFNLTSSKIQRRYVYTS